MVSEGSPAPDFDLAGDTGEHVKLSDLRGKPVVLYFYPKDDTPGCTTEACEFRDAYDRFREQGVEILGVSPDTEDLDALLPEAVVGVAELARLGRAARRVVLGIEVEDDRLPAEIAQFHVLTGVAGEVEVGGGA